VTLALALDEGAGTPFNFHAKHIEPYPYYESNGILDHDFYAALARDFPPVPDAVRTGRNALGNKSIRRTDSAYAHLLAHSAAWRALDRFVYSPRMIDLCMRLFGDALRSNPKCRVDPSKARFVDRNETLSTRDPRTGAYTGGGIRTGPYYHRRRLRTGDPNELYVVMDFFHGPGADVARAQRAGRKAYTFGRHLDWPFRVASLLIYFTDTDESTGGHLQVYNGSRVHRSIAIKQNSGISHLSPDARAWHGVPTYTGQGYRRLVQIQLSSSWSVCRDSNADIYVN